MRIAAVQFYINHIKKQDNWDRVEYYMSEAAKSQADLIVFPEYFIGGPGRSSVVDDAIERLGALAVQYEMDLVPGTIIERDPKDSQLYNCCYYIDKSGRVLMEYRKVHLWHPERSYLSNSQKGFNTIRNRFGIVVGLCICWDIAFPEVFRHMALENHAQLVIAPAYWTLDDGGDVGMKYDPQGEAKLLNAICFTRAFENEICVVFCNAAAHGELELEQPYGDLAGRTQITVPFKGPVAHCDHQKEEMIMAEVDIKQLTKDAESVYQIRKDWKDGYIFGGAREEEVETIIP
ncbi:carbon-nitrogen hydrolase [Spinellus fusiger]|nr:carbon-nitrogen hydrolase [Spinellus fusiger]